MTAFQSMRADDRGHQVTGAASPAPAAGTAGAAGAIDVSPLVGTWWSTDKATGGVLKMELAERAGGLVVHAYGACSPEPCDWGERPAIAYAAAVDSRDAMAFSARFDFGFLETLLAAYMKGGILVLDTFNTFRDGSGRASYFTREFYHR
jgi:hypothetical protein